MQYSRDTLCNYNCSLIGQGFEVTIKNEFIFMIKKNLISNTQSIDNSNKEQSSLLCYSISSLEESIINVQSIFQITKDGFYFSNCGSLKINQINEVFLANSQGDLGEEYKNDSIQNIIFVSKHEVKKIKFQNESNFVKLELIAPIVSKN